MVRLIAGLSVILWTTAGLAEEVLREISWEQVWPDGQLPEGQTHQAKAELDEDCLGVVNATSQPATVGVLALRDLGITTSRYAITGQVRYEGVEGEGYLEMWSCFGPHDRYFSRTLSEAGPMAKLTGSSDWRPFTLPFYNRKGHAPPEELLVNVVLPGRGTVWLRPVRLVQYGAMEDPTVAPGQWWGDRTGGVLGGTLGAVLGCMGGLIGWLTSKGKARNVVLGLLRAMQVVGVGCLLGAVMALVMSQPYCVYYPFLLIGIICPAVGVGVTHTVRKRFDELELRKMSAMDAV